VFDDVRLASEGSFIDAELVVRATGHGYKVVQFAVDYFPRTRGVSTLSSPSVILKILREMWALREELQAISPSVQPSPVDEQGYLVAERGRETPGEVPR
jgi:hypothetical protein